MFGEGALLPVLIEGTRLNLAFGLALAALAAGYVFMTKSFLGFQMQVAGEAEAASRYAGFSTRRMIWIGMLSGGAAAGVAGMGEIAGPMGQLTEHVSNNYGFAAIIVAFVDLEGVPGDAALLSAGHRPLRQLSAERKDAMNRSRAASGKRRWVPACAGMTR
jgi:ABC-type uncharacterized transport system permease subunit